MKKNILTKLLISLYLLSFIQTQSECILGLRIFPLKFLALRKTVELRLNFKSNCTDYPLKFFLILKYNKFYDLNLEKHPRRIILDFKGRAYQLDFSQPEKKTYRGFDNLIYAKARLAPSSNPVRIATKVRNNIFLETSEINKITKEEIEYLETRDSAVICKMMKSKKTLVCKM